MQEQDKLRLLLPSFICQDLYLTFIAKYYVGDWITDNVNYTCNKF